MTSAVEYLTREGCGLCEERRSMVGRIARLVRVDVVDVDVDGDAELAAAYGSRVPVLRAGDGAVLVEGRFGGGAVAAALLRLKLRNDGGQPGRR